MNTRLEYYNCIILRCYPEIACNIDIGVWHSLRMCMLVIVLSAESLYNSRYKCWLNNTCT
jgi:hypothetical protein